MKGLAIHVEQLVIIIIAVLILLAVITFFLGLWNPRSLLYRAKLTEACQVLQNAGCATEVLTLTRSTYMTSIKAREVGGSGDTPLSVLGVCDYVLAGPGNEVENDNVCLRACACMTSG